MKIYPQDRPLWNHFALSMAAIAALSILLLAACDPPAKKKVFHPNAKEYHLKDGRYAMETDSGEWLWYYVLLSGSENRQFYNSNSAAVSGGTTPSNNAGFTKPTGGTWAKGSAPEEEEIQQAEEQPVEAEVGADGMMEPVEASEMGLEPGDSAPADSSASSSSDSGSSDGGDGGGGGGSD